MKHAEPPQVGELQRLLERIAALERERDKLKEQRDEARAEYVRLYDRFDLVIEILDLKFQKRPEWRS